MSQDSAPQIPATSPMSSGATISTLRRFVKAREPFERCEMCNAAIPPDPDHRHLLDTANRQVVCVCGACAVSMGGGHDSARRFRLIPQRVDALADFQMTDALWDGVLIPVGMAFFFFSSSAGKIVAYYPSPAGPTESLLSPDSWEAIVHANPVLTTMEPDVEALLVNRVRGARDYYRVPIDECYRLVGLVRLHWHGLSGGSEVWDEIGKFFADLTRRSQPIERNSHA